MTFEILTLDWSMVPREVQALGLPAEAAWDAKARTQAIGCAVHAADAWEHLTLCIDPQQDELSRALHTVEPQRTEGK